MLHVRESELEDSTVNTVEKKINDNSRHVIPLIWIQIFNYGFFLHLYRTGIVLSYLLVNVSPVGI